MLFSPGAGQLGSILFLSKSEGKDQISIQSSTTPDPGHHMGK